MIAFADTNWLEAMYFEPDKSDHHATDRATTVARRMRRLSGPITISQIVLLEARNLFRRVSGEAKPGAWERLISDLNRSVLLVPFDWPALRQETNRIFERFSHKTPVGTFDATIVASAKLANASDLFSFDEQIRILASCLGIRVFPELSSPGKLQLLELKA